MHELAKQALGAGERLGGRLPPDVPLRQCQENVSAHIQMISLEIEGGRLPGDVFANLSDGLIALKDGKMVMLRVPYPLGFYAKGFDGRIDDPKAGWKGRGLWTTSGDRTPWLMEGGKGSQPMAVHFQIRPDPLAK